ncbi:hypothetical protein E1269_09745 [Jiangella asiatica]|uniref:Uncharacterized protein n=1 Tax=Jiangella asiatica TaxID=2530372 RepID=A0A4R5DDL2_9ACTN|nr:hypothetical protein E1269_09745 [Jiangella asiatica]
MRTGSSAGPAPAGPAPAGPAPAGPAPAGPALGSATARPISRIVTKRDIEPPPGTEGRAGQVPEPGDVAGA